MKKSFLLLTILFFCSFAFGQNELVVQGSENNLYVVHTVAPKENFYSIGRLYNIPPKDMAAYNNLDMNLGLSVGQTIKIPLTSQNFTQKSNGGRALYYVVGEKEGLYRVSTKHNKVLMADLRKWNNLSSDQLSTGQKLVVGFLVSPEANNITATPVANAEVVKTPVEQPKQEVTQEVVKQDPPKQEPVQVKKQEVQPKQTAQTAVVDANGGYFKKDYELQSKKHSLGKDETLTAGIFKTSSGWQDTKYYALIDGVEPGTIVRIVNPTNNKAVYAKVLGQMAGIRQNQGYDMRVSNAAASVLEISDTEKFIVKVNY
jgi:LysM repeat protein